MRHEDYNESHRGDTFTFSGTDGDGGVESNTRSPEHNLLRSVLYSAFVDLCSKDHKNSATQWILDSNSTDPFSIEYVCENLELDPLVVRRSAYEVIRVSNSALISELDTLCEFTPEKLLSTITRLL